MKPSSRAILLQAIRDFVELRDKVQPEYDKLVAVAPEEAKVLMAEVNARSIKLDTVWAQALPEMNTLEARRYILMIGRKMDEPPTYEAPAVPPGEVTEYPAEFNEAIEKIKKVFPAARVVAVGKEGEVMQPPQHKIDIPRERRPSDVEVVKGIPREEPKPVVAEQKPQQLGLI